MAIGVWVGYPRSYTAGRARPVQYVVIHYTAGSEGPTSAESGAAYDKTRTDGTSTHAFADSNSVCVEVPDGDRAHAARFHGNEIGLQLEICGTAQTRAQWLDAASLPTLRLGAKWTAEKCKAYGLPVRRLTVAETRAAYYAAAGARPKGIVGHVDVTNAYPEDQGDHTDPGPDFPWDVFLGMVSEELAALNGTTKPEDGMTLPEGFEVTYPTLCGQMDAVIFDKPTQTTGFQKGMENKLHTHLVAIDAKIQALAVATGVDPAGLQAAVEAAIAAQLPAIADAVVDEEHQRSAA